MHVWIGKVRQICRMRKECSERISNLLLLWSGDALVVCNGYNAYTIDTMGSDSIITDQQKLRLRLSDKNGKNLHRQSNFKEIGRNLTFSYR